MILLLISEFGTHDVCDLGADAVCLILALDGDVYREPGPVSRSQLPLEKRIRGDGVADGASTALIFGSGLHDPADIEQTPLRLHVVRGGQAENVIGDDTRDLEDPLHDSLDPGEGLGAKDAVFVRDAEDDHVVDTELALRPVVEDPVRLIGLEHVLGIGIDVDPGELGPEGNGGQGQDQKSGLRPVHGEPGQSFEHRKKPLLRGPRLPR